MGIVNTLRVAIVGIILTTIIGTVIGVGRFSRNALVRGLCYGYVELFRNVPILLQLLMWYLLLTEHCPIVHGGAADRPGLPGQRRVDVPQTFWEMGHLWGVLGLLAGAVLGFAYRTWAFRKFEETGQLRSMFWVPVAHLPCDRRHSAGWPAAHRRISTSRSRGTSRSSRVAH